MTIQSRRVRNARLVFVDGEVVDYSAEMGESVPGEVLNTDAGAHPTRRTRRRNELWHRPLHRQCPLRREDGRHRPPRRRERLQRMSPGGRGGGNQSAIPIDLITDMTQEPEWKSMAKSSSERAVPVGRGIRGIGSLFVQPGFNRLAFEHPFCESHRFLVCPLCLCDVFDLYSQSKFTRFRT